MKKLCKTINKSFKSIYRFLKENTAAIILVACAAYLLNIIVKIVKDDGTKDGEPYYMEFENDFVDPDIEAEN